MIFGLLNRVAAATGSANPVQGGSAYFSDSITIKKSVRPHSAIGNVPPAVYAKLSDPAKQRDGSLELPWGSAPRPVASQGQCGSNDVRALLPTG
jgi:hypothetical protein